MWIQATHVHESRKDTARLSTMTRCRERCDCSLCGLRIADADPQ